MSDRNFFVITTRTYMGSRDFCNQAFTTREKAQDFISNVMGGKPEWAIEQETLEDDGPILNNTVYLASYTSSEDRGHLVGIFASGENADYHLEKFYSDRGPEVAPVEIDFELSPDSRETAGSLKALARQLNQVPDGGDLTGPGPRWISSEQLMSHFGKRRARKILAELEVIARESGEDIRRGPGESVIVTP